MLPTLVGNYHKANIGAKIHLDAFLKLCLKNCTVCFENNWSVNTKHFFCKQTPPMFIDYIQGTTNIVNSVSSGCL